MVSTKKKMLIGWQVYHAVIHDISSMTPRGRKENGLHQLKAVTLTLGFELDCRACKSSEGEY